jgi:hypothetical protein
MEIISSILKNDPQKQYLEDIMNALENVRNEYRRWTLYKVPSVNIESEDYQDSYCERVFAYELYHQIRLVIEPEPGKILERYQNVLLNGEQVKSDSFFKKLFEGLSKLDKRFKEEGNNRIIPDLVLHKDIGSIDKDSQIYLAEIKMGGNDKALDDLEKLTLLKRSNLSFHFYVFIYVDMSVENLLTKLMDHKKVEYAKDIVCICIKDGEAKCTTLGELLAKYIYRNK